jgi:hypothetical protein
MPEQTTQIPATPDVAGPFRVPAQRVPARPSFVLLDAARRAAGRRAPFPSLAGRPHLTARGAMVAMFGLFFLTSLVSGWLGLGVLTGLGYAAGCVLAPLYVRERAMLQVVVAPPTLFLATVVVVQVLTAQGAGKHGKALSVVEGTALTLAATAPWLLAGTALGVVLAMRRGLPGGVRQFWAELREDARELIGRVG